MHEPGHLLVEEQFQSFIFTLLLIRGFKPNYTRIERREYFDPSELDSPGMGDNIHSRPAKTAPFRGPALVARAWD
jgi:hypothetical protein